MRALLVFLACMALCAGLCLAMRSAAAKADESAVTQQGDTEYTVDCRVISPGLTFFVPCTTVRDGVTATVADTTEHSFISADISDILWFLVRHSAVLRQSGLDLP